MKGWCLLGRTEEHHENVILPDILFLYIYIRNWTTLLFYIQY